MPNLFSKLLRLCLWSLVLATVVGSAHAQTDPPPTEPPAESPATPNPTAASAEPPPAAAPEPSPSRPRISLPATDAELSRGIAIGHLTAVGYRKLAPEDVLAYMTETQIGKEFTPEGLTRDAKALWDSGFFEDISISLTRSGSTVDLQVSVRERPSIKALEFEGNSEVSSEDLTEHLASVVKPGSVLNTTVLGKAVERIRDKYAEEGYFLAEASHELKPQKDGEVLVKFIVVEHEPVTVRRITFVGNYNVPESELRDVMLTGAPGFFDFGTGGMFRQDMFDRDILVLSSLYYDKGYLLAQLATPRIMLTPDRTGIELTITVNEGPRFKIRSLRVYERDDQGHEIEPLGGRRKLREMITARPGEFFNRATLVKDIGAIQTMYRDAGYANVEAPPQTETDAETKEVDVSIPVRRGKLTHFGRIEIRGNTKTRDKVIRREMVLEEGQLYSETGIEESKRRITQLGFFERVDISTEQGDAPDTVNINVEVTEKPTGTFQVGAGFSSIEAFIATAQVQQANLFGNGQSLALQAQISGLRQLIDVRYYEPYFMDSVFSMSANVYDQLRVYENFSQTSVGGSLSYGYPIVQPDLRLSLAYTLEDNQISTSTTSTFFGTASAVSTFQRLPLANLFSDGLTSSVRPTLTYDTRNNQLCPSSGIYLQGSAEFASTTLGSDNEFVKYRGIGRFYYPITDSMVLKLNSELGFVTSPNPEGVPIFARFFLGGILDLRGFPLRSIGPRLPLRASLDENAPARLNGANIGGNLMYFQNLELEFPIFDKVGIRGVVFTDLGNSWNLEKLYCSAAGASPYASTNPCFTAASLAELRTSWGFGVRWFSPLGPLRFEWGFPFQRLPYEDSYVFEFTIGNFF